MNACVRIATGRQATSEHREFATTTAGLFEPAEWLTEAGCTHVAMEATGVYWKPVWHVLEDAESFKLLLANAQHIRNVPGRKSDRKDAAWIADLLAHGLIAGSFVPPAPIQALRDLTRTRAQWLRTVAEVPIEAEFLQSLEPPVYQSIAADAAAMHERGAPVSGIAKHFGVDHHTAAKALRWFRSR